MGDSTPPKELYNAFSKEFTSELERSQDSEITRLAGEVRSLSFLYKKNVGEVVQNLHVQAQEGSLDGLTGLYTRKMFDALFDKKIKALSSRGKGKAKRHTDKDSFTMGVIYVDIDNFKHVNDAYSHGAGDKVIAEVARVIKHYTRSSRDVVGRYGGDELVALMSMTKEIPSLAMDYFLFRRGEAIRRTVEQNIEAVSKKEGKIIKRLPITVSIGVASYNPPMKKEELMAQADRALYLSKGRGRNATSCCSFGKNVEQRIMKHVTLKPFYNSFDK